MHIVIIGYGPGISSAAARLFGSRGFKISFVGRSKEKLEAEAQKLHDQSIEANYAMGDVSEEQSLNAALDLLTKQSLPDVILYNPSASVYKSVEEDTWPSIQQQLSVNVGGAIHVLRRFLPLYKKANQGKIFFTGGGLSLHPSPAMAGLSLGKAALRNLVLGTAAGLKDTNVHVATVTVTGMVDPADAKYNPDAIVQNFWTLYEQKQGSFNAEIVY